MLIEMKDEFCSYNVMHFIWEQFYDNYFFIESPPKKPHNINSFICSNNVDIKEIKNMKWF